MFRSWSTVPDRRTNHQQYTLCECDGQFCARYIHTRPILHRIPENLKMLFKNLSKWESLRVSLHIVNSKEEVHSEIRHEGFMALVKKRKLARTWKIGLDATYGSLWQAPGNSQGSWRRKWIFISWQ